MKIKRRKGREAWLGRYLGTEHASIPQYISYDTNTAIMLLYHNTYRYISYGTNTAIMDDKDECAMNEWVKPNGGASRRSSNIDECADNIVVK